MEDTKTIIGLRINELLAKENRKQKELASYLGVTDNTVSYFCGGKRLPNVEQIIKISKFFNVSADYLLGLSDCSTTDTNIKSICEYTGLSENALDCISEINKNIDLIGLTNECIFPSLREAAPIVNELKDKLINFKNLFFAYCSKKGIFATNNLVENFSCLANDELSIFNAYMRLKYDSLNANRRSIDDILSSATKKYFEEYYIFTRIYQALEPFLPYIEIEEKELDKFVCHLTINRLYKQSKIDISNCLFFCPSLKIKITITEENYNAFITNPNINTHLKEKYSDILFKIMEESKMQQQ